MKPILIMKTGQTVKSVPVEMGDFEHWIIEGMDLPVEQFRVVSVFKGEQLPELSEISALVITGSAAMLTDNNDWSNYSSRYIQQAVKQNIPVLGICFGHQLIAKALGGKVDFHPAGREIGTTVVSLSKEGQQDPLFKNLKNQFYVQVSHSQSVIELPDQAEILASNDFESHHSLRYGENVWGVQFHPEFSAAVMKAYVTERNQDLTAEGLSVEGLLSTISETSRAKSVLLNFAHIVLAKGLVV
ncbi:glutamine amidotransferase [Gammaproteobacteria bacterium]|nr:glutamine amidotransferase [Gammaproteobacteria bacterium]